LFLWIWVKCIHVLSLKSEYEAVLSAMVRLPINDLLCSLSSNQLLCLYSIRETEFFDYFPPLTVQILFSFQQIQILWFYGYFILQVFIVDLPWIHSNDEEFFNELVLLFLFIALLFIRECVSDHFYLSTLYLIHQLLHWFTHQTLLQLFLIFILYSWRVGILWHLERRVNRR
jgi:hypothetical protein